MSGGPASVEDAAEVAPAAEPSNSDSVPQLLPAEEAQPQRPPTAAGPQPGRSGASSSAAAPLGDRSIHHHPHRYPLLSAPNVFPALDIPSSTVVTKPFSRADMGERWREEAMLLPHEPLRLFMQILNDCIYRLDAEETGRHWKLPIIQAFYGEFVHFLRTHHDSEEHVYFPALAARATLPPKVSADHATLVTSALQVEKLLALAATQVDVDDLKRKWSRLYTVTLEHVAEEEEVVPKALQEGAWSVEEHLALVRKFTTKGGSKMMRLTLPAIYYTRFQYTDDADAFLKTLPPPIRALTRGKFMRFLKTHLHNLQCVLDEDEDGIREMPGGGCGCF